jgi:hypothetical protein
MIPQNDNLWSYSSEQWETAFQLYKPISIFSTEAQGYYHYTSLGYALKILGIDTEPIICDLPKRMKSISLNASHFLYLNDELELVDGLKKVEKAIAAWIMESHGMQDESTIKTILSAYRERFHALSSGSISIPNAPNHFILCFCANGNLLSQWKWYGKECGIAIDFNLNECMCQWGQDNNSTKAFIRPLRILYDNTEKKIAIKTVLNTEMIPDSSAAGFAHYLGMHLLVIASLMKHPAFLEENEYRLLFSLRYSGGSNNREKSINWIQYRETNGVVKPYLPVTLFGEKITGEACPLVRSITVGPGHNQQLVFDALVKAIHSRYYRDRDIPRLVSCTSKHYIYTKIGDIEVRRSTIPFRG